jgi:hypothetical protein
MAVCTAAGVLGVPVVAEEAAVDIEDPRGAARRCGKIAVSIQAFRPSHVFTSYSQPPARLRRADDGLD